MIEYAKAKSHFISKCDYLSGVEDEEQSDFEPIEHLEKANYSEVMKKYQINSDYLLREIGGEYAIIPVGEECIISNAVMTPNHSAVFLWGIFQEASTEEEAVQKVLLEYEGVLGKIQNDVRHFVEDSLRLDILKEVE